MKYRVLVQKITPGGAVVELINFTEPGWYASPFLARIAKKIYEPIPKPALEGQQELPL